MSNMSYCRFYNTLQDLKDCAEYLEEHGMSELTSNERTAAKKLVALCGDVAERFGETDADEMGNEVG
jgi:hypothetical protein